MKIKTLYIAFVALCATSCSNFLDQDLMSSVEADGYFANSKNALLAVNGVYSYVATKDNWGIYDANMATSEIGTFTTTTGQSSSRYVDLSAYSISPENDTIERLYTEAYQAIQQANYVIDGVDKMDRTSINYQLQCRYIAEARFLRALLYFNLVRHYGGVPLKTEPTLTSENEFFARSSTEAIYSQIIEDLEYAVENLYYKSSSALSPRYESEDIGRATRCAAMGLLSKVYLTAASTAKHGKFSEAWNTLEINKYDWVDIYDYYTKAAAMAKKLILLSETGQVDVKLNSDFGYLFTQSGENSSESLFEIQYSNESARGSRFGCFVNLLFNKNVYARRITVQPELFFAYEKNFIINDVDPLLSGLDYSATDPRFVWTIATFSNGNNVKKDITAFRDMMFFKYRIGSQNETSDNSPINVPVLRYADVLLCYAEARNELGHTSEAVDYVNKIRSRARAGISVAADMAEPFQMDHNVSSVPADLDRSMGQEDVRKSIIMERFLELAGEGHDRFDEVRMGVLLDIVRNLKMYAPFPTDGANIITKLANNDGKAIIDYTVDADGRTSGAINIKDFNQLFPIPKSELDRTPASILVQNPGY